MLSHSLFINEFYSQYNTSLEVDLNSDNLNKKNRRIKKLELFELYKQLTVIKLYRNSGLWAIGRTSAQKQLQVK